MLAVGRREFLTHGYQRTSVEAIGKAAGVSKQTIYRHFSDKSEILRAIVIETAARFENNVPLVPSTQGTAVVVENCIAAIRASFFDNASLDLFRLGAAIATPFPELAAALTGYFVRSLAPIADQMAMLARAGEITILDPLQASAHAGVLAVEGVRYHMGFPAPVQESFQSDVAAITDLFLNGFMRRTSPAWPSFEIDAAIAPDEKTRNIHVSIKSYFGDISDLRLAEDDLQRLIGIARKSFFVSGYRDSSLDEIGPEARIGRGTLYRWFGGKQGLFKVAMLHAAAEIGARKLPAAKRGAPIETALRDLALAVSAGLCGKTGTQLYRTVIAEVDHDPALARAVYRLTRDRFAAALSAILAKTKPGCEMSAGQLYWAAMQFITLATDGNRYLSLDTKLSAAQRAVLAERAATAFLYGHRNLG